MIQELKDEIAEIDYNRVIENDRIYLIEQELIREAQQRSVYEVEIDQYSKKQGKQPLQKKRRGKADFDDKSLKTKETRQTITVPMDE